MLEWIEAGKVGKEKGGGLKKSESDKPGRV